MSLLWLTPICDPPVWVLRISNLGHYLFPSSAQGAPSEKTSQELRKLPDTSYLESQVWMSVCLSCFLSLSCLSCLSSWHLNLTFQETCDWQLSQFLRFFIELNIFVERGYKCLHILCLWHPLISFPAKLAKLSPPSSKSSQPKKWSPTRFSSTRRTFDPFMTSWLQALSSLWYLFLSVANNSRSTSKLIGFRQPQRIFSSQKAKLRFVRNLAL